ncbi:surface-adhesin E family protein [Sphingomicrobium sp. XHP0239]|uniref:surface-adhesin E family protein n=1 Tax=Sphingomicrobium maritimum TaxID=3133972 RepID=UPI0031CC9519
MSVRFALGATIASIVLAAPVWAAEWEYVGRINTSEGWEFYSVDKTSVRLIGNQRTFWTKVELITPDRDESYTARKSFWRLDCRQWTMAAVSEVRYDAAGNVVASVTDEISLRPIVPETIGEAVAEYACKAPHR